MITWFYGVMVSTLDFESSDPSSSLGRTLLFYCMMQVGVVCSGDCTIITGQGLIVIAVWAGCLDIFSFAYHISPFPSLTKTFRYRKKYCFEGPLNPKQATK